MRVIKVKAGFFNDSVLMGRRSGTIRINHPSQWRCIERFSGSLPARTLSTALSRGLFGNRHLVVLSARTGLRCATPSRSPVAQSHVCMPTKPRTMKRLRTSYSQVRPVYFQ